jgi:hypothetical protein
MSDITFSWFCESRIFLSGTVGGCGKTLGIFFSSLISGPLWEVVVVVVGETT